MIEVEIQVIPTEEQTKALIANAQFISEKILVNELYDSIDYRLTLNGFWLRCRNGVFQLKYPAIQESKVTINQKVAHHEITDEKEIRQILALPMQGSLKEALAAAGHSALYRFTNTRRTYKNKNFIIDFDHADFGDLVYNICEIETKVQSADHIKQALESLYNFAQGYGISSQKAEGKLEHYLRIKHPEHYQKLKRKFEE